MKEKLDDTIHMKIEKSVKKTFNKIAGLEGFDGYAPFLRMMIKNKIKEYNKLNPGVVDLKKLDDD